MRAVNLLPVEERQGRRGPPTAALAVAGVGVLAASLLAVGFMSASGTADAREQELAALEQQLEAAKRAAEPKPAQTGLRTERDERFTALSDALAKRLAWDRVLREVSLVLPDDVWLSSLAAGAPVATSSEPSTTPTTGLALSFNGFTYSQESVARLLSRIALVPDLGNVKLEKSSVTNVGSQEIFNFTIHADVKSPGGTE